MIELQQIEKIKVLRGVETLATERNEFREIKKERMQYNFGSIDWPFTARSEWKKTCP